MILEAVSVEWHTTFLAHVDCLIASFAIQSTLFTMSPFWMAIASFSKNVWLFFSCVLVSQLPLIYSADRFRPSVEWKHPFSFSKCNSLYEWNIVESVLSDRNSFGDFEFSQFSSKFIFYIHSILAHHK